MQIVESLLKKLSTVEPNPVGRRTAEIEFNGDVYRAVSSRAGSHTSAASWGRIDFKKNGKKIAKSELMNCDI